MGVIVAWPVLMVCVVLIVGGVMVKQEHDREDLLRDGKQMTARAEAVMDDVVVVIGFRPNSQVSFYFGQDPVFHNTHGNCGEFFIKADLMLRLRVNCVN